MKVCARCLGPSVRFHPLCRDGHNVGPVCWICERCWSLPSEVIWTEIAKVSSHPSAFKPLHLAFVRPDVTPGPPPVVALQSLPSEVRATR
jgi:hypothetical protein